MKVNDILNQCKRECRYGTYGTTNDQATLDYLGRLNVILYTIWDAWPWPWSLEKISFAMVVGTKTYLVKTKSGNLIDRINDLIPQDSTVTPDVWGLPLQQLDRQDFYAWFAANPTNLLPSVPQKYCNLGLDPNGSGWWQIEVSPSPSQAFTMSGYGKKILNDLLIADVNNNIAIPFFPKGIIDLLLMDGIKAGIYEVQGNEALAKAFDASFKEKLVGKIAEQASAARDDSGITAPPPDVYRFKQRNRSKFGTQIF